MMVARDSIPEPERASVREILLATDFSDAAEVATTVAIDYARRFGARLHLLHVVTSPEERAVTQLLATLVERCGAIPTVVQSVLSGAAAREIVDYARRNRIDLIVMGTHGRTGVSRVLLGSVAERVVRTAPCPVLTVPAAPTKPAPVEIEEAETLGRCVVCARIPTEELICESCRARIRGEALERKQREERPGRR